jgi:hypothetical protein
MRVFCLANERSTRAFLADVLTAALDAAGAAVLGAPAPKARHAAAQAARTARKALRGLAH